LVLSAPGALEVDSLPLYIEYGMVTPSLFFHVKHMGTKPERYTEECGKRKSTTKPGNDKVDEARNLKPYTFSEATLSAYSSREVFCS